MRRLVFLAILICAIMPVAFAHADPTDAQNQYLQKFNQIMPPVAAFTQWQQKTGELPPDFDALAKSNDLPDPFKFSDGRPVQMPQDWPARQNEIEALFEKYIWGTLPPPPKLDQAVIESQTQEPGFSTRTVKLQFGPKSAAVMHVTLAIPDGDGPFPVLFGPGIIGGFGGGHADTLLRRGYIAANYSANDSNDDAAALAPLYPDYDFATLARRAWAAHVVLDYLQTLPQVDRKRVAIFGYSRDGKMATMAAAMDPRISALIGGSTGVGGVLPWRYAGEIGMGEGIESTTRMFPDWFLPRFRYFAGREDRLPVDANLLVGLIAPRSVLMEYGLNDEVSNSWGNEQAYHAMAKIYGQLGVPDRLGILRVPGVHGANDMEACLDWLDIQFGRSNRKWINNFLFPWDYDAWQKQNHEQVVLSSFAQHKPGELKIASIADWEKQAALVRKSVNWMLGQPPLLPPVATPSGRGFGRGPIPGQTSLDVVQWIIGRTTIKEFGWLAPQRDQVASRKISFGYNVTGDLYYPKDTPAGKKLPTVIWLHGYSYPLGYMWVYRVDLHPILALTQAGYAVLAFDQSGFGSRMNEAAPFYDRYPHWSVMGRMVEDTRAAIDALQKDARIDPDKIFLFGYSMGGTVALHTAALEPRVKGVVSICGFTPMRTDTAAKQSGGVARLSHLRGLLPRLGLFVGAESRIPYDYNELIAAIAPRPVYVMQPQIDRTATVADVDQAVEEARKVYTLYNASDQLVLDSPWDYARLSGASQERIIQWMSQNMR